MNKIKNRKGFTLIELLIVITIIGILAVAFLPTLLGAPAKGRDTARIADLQKIQKVLIEYDLSTGGYPAGAGCIDDNATSPSLNFDTNYGAALGGTIPVDPLGTSLTYGTTACTAGQYYYMADPASDGSYEFLLMAQLEDDEAGNAECTTDAVMGGGTTCYKILSQ